MRMFGSYWNGTFYILHYQIETMSQKWEFDGEVVRGINSSECENVPKARKKQIATGCRESGLGGEEQPAQNQ